VVPSALCALVAAQRERSVVPDDGTEEIYVHHSKIEVEGFRTLEKGQRVRFVVTVGRRGREA